MNNVTLLPGKLRNDEPMQIKILMQSQLIRFDVFIFSKVFEISSKLFILTLALVGGDRLSSVESQQENELRARDAVLSK